MICGRNSRSSLASELFDSCPHCVQNRHRHHSKRHRIKSPSPSPNMTKHSSLQISNFMDFEDQRVGGAWSLSDIEMSSPTMDVWNKFEMGLPTPPSSPERDSSTDGEDFGSQSMWDSLLDSQLNFAQLNEPLNTKLIQDCMWSATQPEADKPCKPNSQANRNRTVSCSGDAANSLDCVDPTSVFPYPISVEAKTCLGSSNALITAPSSSLAVSSSVLDTPSPSESEDDEEIDVVTIPTSSIVRKSSRGSLVARNVESASAQVPDMHNYSNVNHSAHSDHHYSQPYSTQSAPQSPQISSSGAVSVLKRSRPMSMPSSPQPYKKSRSSEQELKRACQKLYSKRHSGSHSSMHSSMHSSHSHSGRSDSGRGGSSSSANSRASSDSEEGEGKRAQHNVLERKRRNDLKYSFCTLRASVPDISSAERTPKVTILKKASEYVIGMKRRHNSLEVELSRQRHRHEQLRAKLRQLKEDDDMSFL